MSILHIILKWAGVFSLVFLVSVSKAQEPNFSQFISSPLTINPALCGSSDADWRVSSIVRRQWIGNVSPYSTQTISIDGKIKNFDDQRYFALGGMVLAERVMDGLYKTNFLSLNASYHQPLDEKGNGLSASVGLVSGSMRLDMASLSFDQQLSSTGFDQALPTGETSIGGSSSHTSATAGILYTYDNDYSFVNVGLSGYRFVGSTRSLMNNPSQKLAPRYTAHADFGTTLSDNFSATFSALHLVQDGMSVTSLGTIFGFLFQADQYSEDRYKMINAGIFYRINDAIAPYLGYIHNNIQLGISYDVNASSTKGALSNYKSVELSIVYKKFLPKFRKRIGRYHSPY
jgi:type IX secretion system PorP/SprF family membrane protein